MAAQRRLSRSCCLCAWLSAALARTSGRRPVSPLRAYLGAREYRRSEWSKRGNSTALALLREWLTEVEDVTYACQHLRRVGGHGDGSYVVCEDLPWRGQGGCTILGYGIDFNDRFEIESAQRWGCQVHEFDPTVSSSQGAKLHPDSIHFHQQGLWSRPTTLKIGKVDSLENHIRSLHHAKGVPDSRLVVKIDVEGAEWPALSAASDSLLKEIDHLIVEFHIRPEDVFSADMPDKISLLRRLKRHFYVYHIHFNNCGNWQTPEKDCHQPFPGAPGYYVGNVELALVRRQRIAGVPQGPFSWHSELDERNVPWMPPLTRRSYPVPP
mmetsp:Transcript_51775/g.160394  ORF Transcript_51775/g.160394 Transcript_51775/m.160394 type:complete len:324 (+) Transcript_51775:91-1062(+)